MSKVDGRKIPHAVREKIRFEAINDWLDGMRTKDLTAKYGTSRKILRQWVRRYEEGGFEALKTKPGLGRGHKPRLTAEQKEELSLLLRTSTPMDHGFQTPLWTSTIIAELVKEIFDVSYAAATVRKILKGMGFSPQKPRWGAWQQDPQKI